MIINENPKVSIILPTYNRAHSLPGSIKSVLSQTYKNIELIIVDDGSRDNTEEVVESFDDTCIKYIKCDKNKGAPSARNTGIKASKGEFIAFQDSDDEWLPEKLEKQVNALENASAEYGAVYSGYWVIWPDKKEYKPKSGRAKSGNIYADLLEGNFVNIGILIKKEILAETGLFDENLSSLEDWEFYMRVSKYYHFIYIKEPLLNVFISSDSTTVNTKKILLGTEDIFKKHSVELAENRKYLAKLLYGIGLCFYNYGEIEKGRKYFFNALKYYPFNIKFLITAFGSLFSRNIYKNLRAVYDSFIRLKRMILCR